MKKTTLPALAACIGMMAGLSRADTALNLNLPAGYTNDSFLIALNEASKEEADTKPKKNLHVDFEEPTFSGEKFHQYLGLTTLGLVALTAIAPKEEDGLHEIAAQSAALAAGATVGTGLVFHWNDFHLEDGITEPDNLHMILGSVGALLMAAAVSQAPEGGHAGLGILGGSAMAVAVKITW